MHPDYLSLPGQPRCPQSGECRTWCQCVACEAWRAEERLHDCHSEALCRKLGADAEMCGCPLVREELGVRENVRRTDIGQYTATIGDKQLSSLWAEVCQLRLEKALLMAQRDELVEQVRLMEGAGIVAVAAERERCAAIATRLCERNLGWHIAAAIRYQGKTCDICGQPTTEGDPEGEYPETDCTFVTCQDCRIPKPPQSTESQQS